MVQGELVYSRLHFFFCKRAIGPAKKGEMIYTEEYASISNRFLLGCES